MQSKGVTLRSRKRRWAEELNIIKDWRQSKRQSRDVKTRSLSIRRVDGNLKVVAVEVGRLVQHGQHILNQNKETKINFKWHREGDGSTWEMRLVSLTGNMSCWLPWEWGCCSALLCECCWPCHWGHTASAPRGGNCGADWEPSGIKYSRVRGCTSVTQTNRFPYQHNLP